MIFELVKEISMLILIIMGLYFVFEALVHLEKPWSARLGKQRFSMLMIIILGVGALEISEDVLAKESQGVDAGILSFVHKHVPAALNGFFYAVTFTGSSRFLLPLTTATTILLFINRRRLEALMLASSVISGSVLVYVVKMSVGRVRPELWDTELYWGSSFPSGHTLVVTAFATAFALCISKIWPTMRWLAFSIAVIWILLVAFSRLVLGVHWPTDVLAAVFVGAFLPLSISALLEFRRT